MNRDKGKKRKKEAIVRPNDRSFDRQRVTEKTINDNSISSSSKCISFEAVDELQKVQDESVDDTCDELESDGDDDSNDSSEGVNLSIKFFLFAKEQLSALQSLLTIPVAEKYGSKNESSSLVEKAKKALEKCKILMLESVENETLRYLLQKAEKRDSKTKVSLFNNSFILDGKVPPGSAKVMRTVTDSRYLLCVANLELYKLFLLLNDPENAYSCLRESLIWFPRHIVANMFLADALRSEVSTTEAIAHAETIFRKCMETGTVLIANLKTSASLEEDFELAELDRELREQELQLVDKATEALILLLCQEKGHLPQYRQEAHSLLLSKKFTWKLSNEVLQYPLPSEGSDGSVSVGSNTNSATCTVKIVDNALPETALIEHLQHIFRSQSPFWSEHNYDTTLNCSRSVGYFSYLFPLHDRPACCSVEQIILRIYSIACEHFPAVRDAKYAEWWVHTRPHSNGHQLHFDSDETRIEAGRSAAHPIVSCVLFLSDDIGGPTLMTDQLISGPLASKGWLCHSKTNRLMMFDASYLHGVLPGRGACPSMTISPSRRLTFMVGFWKTIAATDRGLDHPGPGQPFPNISESNYTWPAEMLPIEIATSSTISESRKDCPEVIPIPVSCVWEPIDCLLSSHSEERASTRTSPVAPSYNQCFQGF
mmetsp:Transcript_20103/g.28814  ORF Transcript_20103/g.28814 Transcript_20103/m.28814 type:complete len:654 (-) Transcript_20103:234-2195(-)